MSHFRSFVAEIHRRSLWQVLGLYAVASWIIYQVVLALYEGIGLPHWVPGTALVLLLIGLPIVLATAFVQEGAPTLQRDDRRTTLVGLETNQESVAAKRHGEEPGQSAESESRRNPPSAGQRRSGTLFTWSKAVTGGVLSFAALGVAASGFMGMRAMGIGPAATLVSAGALEKQGRVVLADFRTTGTDSTLAAAVTEALRADLSQSNVMEVASRNEVASLLRRMEREGGEALSAAAAREVAIRGGMKAVISGEVSGIGRGYVLTAEIAGSQEGNVLATFRETAADSSDLIPAIDRLSKAIREKVGESLRSVRQSPYVMAITTPSLSALKKLVQAYDADNRGDSERALALLEDAIELDPSFAAAHRKRGAILTSLRRTAESIVALEVALEHPERLTDYERYHAEALHAHTTGDWSAAAAGYRTLIELDSGDAGALNNLSIVYASNGQWDRAVEVLEKAVELNLNAAEAGTPVYGGTFTMLAHNRWVNGDTAGAMEALRLLAELQPDHPSLLLNRSEMYGAAGRYSDARADLGRLLEQNASSPSIGSRSRIRIAALDAAAGRVRAAVGQLGHSAELNERMDYAPGALEDGVRIALLATLVQNDASAARATLVDYRRRFPIDLMAPEDVPYDGLIMAYAAAGLPDSARAFLERLETWPAPWYTRRYAHALPAGEGAVALAEERFEDAAHAYTRAHENVRVCPGCFLAPLGIALSAGGQPDSAITVLTRYLELPWSDRVMPYPIEHDGDQLFLGLVLERLGELHEQRGDRDAAARYYRRLTQLWQNADPELQPRVEGARRALARLTREGGD